jgi:hypothetical protein
MCDLTASLSKPAAAKSASVALKPGGREQQRREGAGTTQAAIVERSVTRAAQLLVAAAKKAFEVLNVGLDGVSVKAGCC